ncbi:MULTISPECIES: PTS sugar transporter subunit IIA [Latilactobacillus]|uniref:PTS sugar transporter subunit IIA n=1 Tax=Latilactobacillus TaxID=2767885 RepID=UPI0022449EFA|nr:PTS mannose transporter subunit IIA [Latilactobacillus curvatus]MCW8779201.1 PTS mannose transporter subunit IIA [Latilactobacillus curvatus]
MKKILIATHGDLAFSLKKTVELIAGPTDVECFGMTSDKTGEQGKRELNAIIDRYQKDELLVLTDLFGGSPANICTELLLRGADFKLISGVNLPMLLTLLTLDIESMSMQEVIDKIINSGNEGIININSILTKGDPIL